MLNSHDLENIKKDVAAIINDWSVTIEIWKLLPNDQQPNWNPIMREIDGEKEYNKLTNINVQRTDVHDVQLDSNVAGDIFNGIINLCIPESIIVDEDCIFIMDDAQWRVTSMKYRNGENIVAVRKLVGDTDGT